MLEARIAPAAAILPVQDLSGLNGFRLDGSSAGDRAGHSVSDVGDVNGDGLSDFIVGAYRSDVGGVDAGAAYVIFGTRDLSDPFRDLGKTNPNAGFRITGGLPNDFAGVAVSGAGDVNGDGFADILVGAPGADTDSDESGAAYVIFGKGSGFADLNLSNLDGVNGFRITGPVFAGDAGFGRAVSSAGDINGDGFDDVVIGALYAEGNGAAYVIFGSGNPFPATLRVSQLNSTNGFKFVGSASGDNVGYAVSGVGDFNGDGFDDVLVGASGVDTNGDYSGAAYLIFGAPEFPASFNPAEISSGGGIAILGQAASDYAGSAVGAAGDVNGDGFDDLLIGASGADVAGADSGAAYLVYGKASGSPAVLNLDDLDGDNGSRFDGARAGDSIGFAVSSAGDLNQDGFDDLLIGGIAVNSRGAAYVVFGRSAGFEPGGTLDELNGIAGFKISGNAKGDATGYSVRNAGDVNGDGYDDLIVGAPTADPNGASSGSSYVIFGFDDRVVAATNSKAVTLTDIDGDSITIRVSKGNLVPQNIIVGPDGSLVEIDLAGDERFTGANITITAEPNGGGDGVVNLQFLNADELDLGKVKISGTLGRVVAGDGDATTRAIKSLTVGSLGTADLVAEPLLSEIVGSLGKLTVLGDVRGAALTVAGKLGKVAIGGDLVGDPGAGAVMFASIMSGRGIDPRVGGGIPVGAVTAQGIGSFTVKGAMNGGTLSSDSNIGSVNVNEDIQGSAIAAGAQIKVVRVFGSLTSDDPDQPTLVAALAKVGSTKPAGAVAIDKLTVNGDVQNAEILLGYRREVADEQTNYLAKNPDASGGKVLVKGDWIASSLVAGIFDATGDGFGQNDEPIEGDTTTRIFARLASIVIKGTATGSAAEGDQYAITAQQVGKLSINGESISLSNDSTEKDDILLDPANGDFRVVEL